MNEFHSLIQDICQELQIKVHQLSKDWVLMLEKDGKTRFLSGYKFDLNGHALGWIEDDKYAMFDILTAKGIPVIEHTIAFSPENKHSYAKDCNQYQIILDYFNQHHQNIVVKANTSTCGRGVFHVTEESTLQKVLDQLFQKHYSISLCPFYEIQAEYRLIYLKGECLLLYGKKRPSVIGDGKRTIRELLLPFNPCYFQKKVSDPAFDRVLRLGEVYEYDWKFNLSSGAISFPVTDKKLKEKLLKLGNNISREIELGFCSVDIVETGNKELYVMEINSGVMMKNYIRTVDDGFKTAREIYKKTILAMFQ